MTAAHPGYQQALQAIWQRSGYDRGFISNPFAGDDAAQLGLRRTRQLLDELGAPDRRLPLLHVAGSKGKGSTCAFASSLLTAHGQKTGRYTSPHLHTFRERFAIDDEPIAEATFATLTHDVIAAAERIEASTPELGQITAFELLTAMAFLHFAGEGCDAAVIEVGLGGTLDATNVISPAGCVITALDFEHTHILGPALRDIAANKAGIIKPGVPVATDAYVPEARAVIADRAQRSGVRWLEIGRDVTVEGAWREFSVAGPWGILTDLCSPLPGDHQAVNAALAIAGVWIVLGAELDPRLVRDGIARTRWPGRFERIDFGGRTLILDGAHTPAAARALANAVESVLPGSRASVILGVLRDKDAAEIATELAGIAAEFIAVAPPGPRGMPAAELAGVIAPRPVAVRTADSLDAAFAASSNNLVLVTGSLATVAAAREALGLANPDPANPSAG